MERLRKNIESAEFAEHQIHVEYAIVSTGLRR